MVLGDADLYIWPPDHPWRPPWVSNLSNGAKEISFTAPVSGVYQVEVFGYSAATYQLLIDTVKVNVASAAYSDVAVTPDGLDSNKPLPDMPIIPIRCNPSDVSICFPQQILYFPIIAR